MRRQMVGEAADLVQSTLEWVLANDAGKALSAATNIQETFGLCLGAWIMGDSVGAARERVAAGDSGPFQKSKLALAHVCATHVFPKARACHKSVISGTGGILNLSPDALQTTCNA